LLDGQLLILGIHIVATTGIVLTPLSTNEYQGTINAFPPQTLSSGGNKTLFSQRKALCETLGSGI